MPPTTIGAFELLLVAATAVVAGRATVETPTTSAPTKVIQ
jgi:hypothetical protein